MLGLGGMWRRRRTRGRSPIDLKTCLIFRRTVLLEIAEGNAVKFVVMRKGSESEVFQV